MDESPLNYTLLGFIGMSPTPDINLSNESHPKPKGKTAVIASTSGPFRRIHIYK